MAYKTGYIGGAGSSIDVRTVYDLEIKMAANDYPTKVRLQGQLRNGSGSSQTVTLYLCDSSGGNRYSLGSYTPPANGTQSIDKEITIAGTRLKGKDIYITGDTSSSWLVFRNLWTVTVSYVTDVYTISTSAGSGGTLRAYTDDYFTDATEAEPGTIVYLEPTPGANYSLSGYSCLPSSLVITNNSFVMPSANVSIVASFTQNKFTVTCKAGTGGSLKANYKTAAAGTTVTLTPTPNTGYQLSSYTRVPSGLSISGNKFTMPAQNVTVTANFSKISYSITKLASPSGGGTPASSVNSATMGTEVTLSQTAAAGHLFKSWSISPSSVTIKNNKFTMPAANVTVTANYRTRSTAKVNKTRVEGGSTLVMTIATEDTSYTHRYTLSWGTGMEVRNVSVAAKVTSVTINIPENWCNSLPNAAEKEGGTLTLQTYTGSTLIGSYTVTGLIFVVPTSAVPTVSTLTTDYLRTVGGVDYANVGDYYIQNHSGVTVNASGSGALGSTVTSVEISIAGYSGTKYNKLVSGTSAELNSGLLTIAGKNTITAKVTDSRGRTKTRSTTITVQKYNMPTAGLVVKRADAAGDPDATGIYGIYEVENSYTAIGSNAKADTLSIVVAGTTYTQTGPAATGDLMPGNRLTFGANTSYTVTYTVADAFETVTVTANLPTAYYIMYMSADGYHTAFGQAASKTAPSGKNGTLEISGLLQMYMGNETAEDYFRGQVVQEITGLTVSTAKSYTVPKSSRHLVVMHSWNTDYCAVFLAGRKSSGNALIVPIYTGSKLTVAVSGTTVTVTGAASSGSEPVNLYDIILAGDPMTA